MQKIFYIEDTPANKISYYLLLAFLVTLPFDRMYSELALIALLLHTLIHLKWKWKWSEVKKMKWSLRWTGWMSAGLYLLTMLGTLYAPKPSQAFPEWEKQLALILFPLIIWCSGLDWQIYRLRLMKGFAFSCVFTAIYLYGVAFCNIYSFHEPFTALFTKPYMNHAFSAPIDLHATYFSAYLALSLIVFADLIFRAKEGWWLRAIYSLAIIVCLAAIFQLASRAVCIAVVIIANMIVPFLLARGKTRVRLFVVSFSLTVIALTTVSQNAHLHSRYLLQLKEDLRADTGAVENPEPRMARWLCAWQLIKASPWIGYGTGAETEKLKEKYYTHHLTISYMYGLNAHNQFLSGWLRTGIFGVLWYVTALILGLRRALRRRDIYLTAFLLIVTCISCAENILDVNKGIFFFSCFFVLFVPKPMTARIFTYGNKNTGASMGARARGRYRILP